MRRAIDSLVIWMNDANLYTLPTYDMREGATYSACREDTKAANSYYNELITTASINDVGYYTKFAETVSAWLFDNYANI